MNKWRNDDTGWHRITTKNNRLNCIAVYCEIKSFAHPHITKRIFILDVRRRQRCIVNPIAKENGTVFRANRDLNTRRISQPFDILDGHFMQKIHLA
ncbi:MAG: hypothetical protein GAK38_04238 [Xylophilus sp.]|nr:MAG: hypothetical protein GAK38_04238 [Xylophilus sp.]